MKTHLCIQCKHYQSVSTSTGTCSATGESVWSVRPECTGAAGIDLFEPLDTTGNALRTARETAGVSRDEVCMDLDVSMRSLQKWELDERKPPKHTIKMLLDYYQSKSVSRPSARV